MKKRLKFCLPVLLILTFSRGFAQESIMTDISYSFLQKLIDAAKQNYPLIKIKKEQAEIARTTYKESKFAWLDNLSTSYNYNPYNSLTLANNSLSTSSKFFLGYQIGVTLNVGTLFKTPFTIKIAKENYAISQLEQDAFTGSINTQVTKLYLTYLQSLASLKNRTKTALDVEVLLNEAKRQFEKGNETIENYTNLTTSFSNINQLKIDAEVAVLIAKTSLEELIGEKLEEVK